MLMQPFAPLPDRERKSQKRVLFTGHGRPSQRNEHIADFSRALIAAALETQAPSFLSPDLERKGYLTGPLSDTQATHGLFAKMAPLYRCYQWPERPLLTCGHVYVFYAEIADPKTPLSLLVKMSDAFGKAPKTVFRIDRLAENRWGLYPESFGPDNRLKNPLEESWGRRLYAAATVPEGPFSTLHRKVRLALLSCRL